MDQQHLNKAYLESILQSLDDSLEADESQRPDIAQLRKDLLDFEEIEAGKEAALQKVSGRIFKEKKKLVSCIPLVVKYMAAAAIIGGIVFVGIRIFEQPSPPIAKALQSAEPCSPTSIQTSEGKDCELVLGDGSMVTLRERTKLEYPANCPKGTNITLAEGEAEFKLAKDSDRPLKVDVAGKNIAATGTVFVMKANQNEVVITSDAFAEGVKMTNNNTLEVGLKADMQLEYDSATKSYRFVNVAKSVTPDAANKNGTTIDADKNIPAGINSPLTLADAGIFAPMDEIARWYDADINCAMRKTSLRGKSLYSMQDEIPLPFNQTSNPLLRTWVK